MSTQDSTAALKKMLGVPTTTSPTRATTSSPKQVDGPPKSNNKSSQKKKRNSSSKKGKQNQHSQDSKSQNKKSESGKKKGKNKQGGGKQMQTSKDKFAWSEFQNLPDASTLPVPAFSSPGTSTKKTVEGSEMDPDKLSVLLENAKVQDGPSDVVAPEPTPLVPIDAARAEDVEAAILNAQEKRNETNGADGNGEKEKHEEVPLESKDESGGVNLAAIAASPPKKAAIPAHLRNAPAPPPGPPPMQQQHVQPPHPNQMMPPQQMQQHPYAMQRQQFATPPGYVTVQVQVPPQLLPGRRMVVASPAGYPVQIVVPGDLPPGAVIPVHVPAPPQFQYSPYHQHPAHMHPPPHQPPAY